MNNKMKTYIKALGATLVIIFFLILTFVYWRKTTSPLENISAIASLEEMEKVGVPKFKRNTITSVEVDVEKLKGKVVIINFWASWCGPCIEEVPSFIKLIDEFDGKVQLVAISGDSTREDIDSFLKVFPKIGNKNIHVIWDEDRTLMKMYSVTRLPESFVVDPSGKLVKKIVGTINWHTPESIDFMNQLLVNYK